MDTIPQRIVFFVERLRSDHKEAPGKVAPSVALQLVTFSLAPLLGLSLELGQNGDGLLQRRLLALPSLLFVPQLLLRFCPCLLERFQLFLFSCFFLGYIRFGQVFVFLDESLLLVVAALHRHRVALSLEGRLGETLKCIEVAASLVVLCNLAPSKPVFDGWISLNAHLLAESLTGSGAVHVQDGDGVRVLVGVRQLVPCGLHVLTVTSPGGQKLDEGALFAADVVIELRFRNFSGCKCSRRKNGKKKHAMFFY